MHAGQADNFTKAHDLPICVCEHICALGAGCQQLSYSSPKHECSYCQNGWRTCVFFLCCKKRGLHHRHYHASSRPAFPFAAQITVDIFAFNMLPIDLPSLAAIPRYTCGDLNHYAGAHACMHAIVWAQPVLDKLQCTDECHAMNMDCIRTECASISSKKVYAQYS